MQAWAVHKFWRETVSYFSPTAFLQPQNQNEKPINRCKVKEACFNKRLIYFKKQTKKPPKYSAVFWVKSYPLLEPFKSSLIVLK